VLPRLHRAVVYHDQPTTGIDAIQLLHYISGGNFPDVTKYRILVRCYYASQSNFCDITSIYHTSIDYLLINTGLSPLSNRNTIDLDLFQQLMKLSKIRKYYY